MTSAERSMIQSTTTEIVAQFGPEHWREKEENEEFSQAFWDELAEAAFQGMLIPKEHDIGHWWREINLIRLVSVTQQMAFNHISQKLDFPKFH